MDKFDDKEILDGMKKIISGLGLDLNDPDLKDTPKRVLRGYYEILEGLLDTDEKINKILSITFPSKYEGMIVEGPIHCYSLCPHHFLPIVYDIFVGYIPKGKSLGLSKLPRLIELLARRPIIQEDLTRDIAEKIEKILKPQGVAVFVKGTHFCMSMRGVRNNASTVTSEVTGVFRKNIGTRMEFLDFIKTNGFNINSKY